MPQRRAVFAAKATSVGLLTLCFGELLGAASQVVSLHPGAGLLPPGRSMLILAAWPVAALLVAAIVITRRDT